MWPTKTSVHSTICVVSVSRPDGSRYSVMPFKDAGRAKAYVQSYVTVCGKIKLRAKRKIVFFSGVVLKVDEPWCLCPTGAGQIVEPDSRYAPRLVDAPVAEPVQLVVEGPEISLQEICTQIRVDVRRARAKLRKGLKDKPDRWAWPATSAQIDEVKALLERL